MRFVDGGKETFLASYAYLADAAEKKNYSEFTDSIVFCLEHYEYYDLVTKVAIADLVKYYGHDLKNVDPERLIKAIDDIYPTGNLLLDVIFSEFTIYKRFLFRCPSKHAVDYMEQKNIEFYLAEPLYDLGTEESREEMNEYAKNSVYRDPIMQVVATCGIDYIELYKKLHASKILNNKIQDFVGVSNRIPETNTVYKSYEIQYALHAIIEKAFCERKPELIPQSLLLLLPDYQGMYRLFKCREVQPQNHLFDKSNSCEPFLKDGDDDYILIGCSEIRKRIDYKQRFIVYAHQGIAGENEIGLQKPFNEYITTSIEKGRLYMLSDKPESLIYYVKTWDLELEDEDYLMPGMDVAKFFNVHVEFDFFNGRYNAVNQAGDIVFIMKKWSSCYKGDRKYPGDAIPLYIGSKLYIKKNYIQALEQHFGTLMMKTYVHLCMHA